MSEMDWSKVTDSDEVKELLLQRECIEKKIQSIEEMALVLYEVERLSMSFDE